MAKGYILYNSIAGNGECAKDIHSLDNVLDGELEYIEVSQITDYKVFVAGLEHDDYIVLCGGDGTLNRFVNNLEGVDYKNEILYYPMGSGNDFAHDLGKGKRDNPFVITEYLKNLPVVTVNGKKYRFINGVGFGIDGYCCEVGDELRATTTKPINYTSIAIKGLLFHYKPTNAKITVDGETHTFKKVWLAPTMNGRFYGGGMMPTPEQTRKDTVSTMVYYGKGKLLSLIRFPSLFKGEHVKHKDMIAILKGKKITVEFDAPRALQIDGETIKGVTSYTAEVVE